MEIMNKLLTYRYAIYNHLTNLFIDIFRNGCMFLPVPL